MRLLAYASLVLTSFLATVLAAVCRVSPSSFCSASWPAYIHTAWGRLLNLLLLFGFQHLSHHQLDGAQRQSCILLPWHFFFSLLSVAKLAVVKAAQLLLAPDLAGRQHVEHDFFFVS